MIRRRESPLALLSGVLAVLVHGLFFLLLVVSFSWKNTPEPQVAQVELWASLPQTVPPEPEPTPKPEPRPEPPPPPKPEPKPEPVLPPEPKADIQLKPKPEVKKPEPKQPPKEEPKKPEPKKAEPKKPDPAEKAREEEQKRKEALRRLQQDLLDDEQPQDREDEQAIANAKAVAESQRAAAALSASSGIVDEYKARIVAAIKRNVNRQVCGSGKPALVYAISLMPTGEVSGTPKLVKSSGLPACDDAVLRAILKAQPLPLPPQAELFAHFRDLTLTFRPNDDQ